MPLILAISANSPVWQGRDSGFASWRGIHFARWPVEGPPPAFADLEDHERRVEALLGTGAVMDRGQLYWHVRLSERYPTVEIRVADVQLDVESAVVLAGVIRALVVTALAEHRADGMLPVSQAVPLEVLRAATWRAARDGLAGHLVDLRGGGVLPAAQAIEGLLEYVDDALAAAGDQEVVSAGLRGFSSAVPALRRSAARWPTVATPRWST
jgi:carboxylate-amine ligase